jgi:hypothetical protein
MKSATIKGKVLCQNIAQVLCQQDENGIGLNPSLEKINIREKRMIKVVLFQKVLYNASNENII